MYSGQEFYLLGNWARIHFTENEGMAFGMQLGGQYGKLFLSIFRIAAVMFIFYFMIDLARKGAPKGLIASMALIFSGAIGNIIDSVFYGVIFSDSNIGVATLFPPEGGYSTWFYGRVVDMFYFPIFSLEIPENFPFMAGKEFLFFRPVFNVADAAITVGVFIILIFQRDFFKEEKTTSPVTSDPG